MQKYYIPDVLDELIIVGPRNPKPTSHVERHTRSSQSSFETGISSSRIWFAQSHHVTYERWQYVWWPNPRVLDNDAARTFGSAYEPKVACWYPTRWSSGDFFANGQHCFRLPARSCQSFARQIESPEWDGIPVELKMEHLGRVLLIAESLDKTVSLLNYCTPCSLSSRLFLC